MNRTFIAVLLLLAVGVSTGCGGGRAGEPDKATSQQPSSPPQSAPAPQATAQTTAPVAESAANAEHVTGHTTGGGFQCDYGASCTAYLIADAKGKTKNANLVCFRQGMDYLGSFFVIAYLPPEQGDHGVSPSLLTTEVFKDGNPSPALPPNLSLQGGHAGVAGYHGEERFPTGNKETAIVDDDGIVLTSSYKSDQRKVYYIFTMKRPAGTFTETFYDVSNLPQQVVGAEKGNCVQVKPFDFSKRP
jgi:hypothetical protein